MSDEAAVQAAPEVESQPEVATEQATTPENATEANQEKDTAQAEAKTFTQEEVDRIAQKERSKAERKATREYQAKLESIAQSQSKPQQSTQASNGEPQLEDFEKVQDYVKAVARFELNQDKAVAQQRQAEQHAGVVATKVEKIFDDAEKLGNFDRDEFARMPVSTSMADTILGSEVPAAIVHYLSSNPDEVERIAEMTPARQAAEIGKLEVKLSNAAKVKPSNAPAPVKPIGSRGGAASGNPAEMTQAEYEAWRGKQGANWARR